MAKPRARSIMFALIGIAVVAFLIKAFQPQPLPVDVAQVGSGPLTVTIVDDGRTRVKELYVVSSPVAGRVLRLDPEVGDKVIAGETLLASMLPSGPAFLDERRVKEAEAVVKAAEASLQLALSDVARVEAEVEYAQAEISRAEALVQSNAASPARLDKAKLSLKTSEAQLSTVRSNVRKRQADLDVAKAALIGPAEENGASDVSGVVNVMAPISGSVLALRHESEGVVASGTPLLEIGDADDVEVIADFLSHLAVQVKPGANVMVEAWGGEPLPGKVRLVEPKGFTKFSALGIEEQRVNIIIDFDKNSEASKRIGHGFRVEPRIVLSHQESVLRVPTSAIFREEGVWSVFAINQGVAELKYIELGAMNDDYAEVLSGIQDGVEIILYPSEKLQDGVFVIKRHQ